MKRVLCLCCLFWFLFSAASVCAETAAPEAQAVPEPCFTVAWLSDTQRLVYQEPTRPQLTAVMDWVRDNAEKMNILCLVQTGDFADNMFKSFQSDCCDAAVERLAPVPFLGIAGNHDIGFHAQDYSIWQARPFIKSLPPENKYDGGKCVSGLFSSGSSKIIIVGLGYGMRTDPDALAWARAQFDAYPDIPGILLCHEFLNDRGQYLLGYPVMEEVAAKCPNIRLILCGHSHTNLRKTFTFDDNGDGIKERTVNVLLFDFQQEWNDKLSYLALLTFDPNDRSLSVITYSPFLDDYICHDEAADTECFRLENAF